MINRSWRVVAVVVLALALLMAVMGPMRLAVAGAGDPGPGTVVGYKMVTFASADAAAATTYYGEGGAGQPALNTAYWHNADVFITADVSGTDKITLTAQWSADNTNWVDADYKAEGWVLPMTYGATVTSTTTLTNASGVTSTTTSTATQNITSTYSFAGSTGTRVSEQVPYRLVVSADGSDHLIIPLRGLYLRFKAEVSGTVTSTIKVVLRNDGGH